MKIIGFLLVAVIFQGYGQKLSKKQAELFESGRYKELKSLIKNDYSINGYFLKGLIAKEEGDIDYAWDNWKKSNALRLKKYGHKNAWFIWNHVLASNYHYEKIEVKSAVAHADTAMEMLKNLSDNQKKQIEAHHIYILLGQSVKSEAFSDYNIVRIKKVYQRAFNLYSEANLLIQKHNVSDYYLAKSHHLIGNCHTDLSYFFAHVIKLPKEVKFHFSQADKNYEKAERILKNKYGKVHHSLATVYFVHGLLWKYKTSEATLESLKTQKKYYNQALSSYGINGTNFERLNDYSGALMTYRYLNEVLLTEAKIDGYFNQKEKISINKNLISATKLWHQIQRNFKSTNKNLHLAIYVEITLMLTTPKRFKLTTLKRSILTTPKRSMLTT